MCHVMFSDAGRIMQEHATHMCILVSALIGWLFSVNNYILLFSFRVFAKTLLCDRCFTQCCLCTNYLSMWFVASLLVAMCCS